MKCFVILSAVLGLSAAQFYPIDTPEVAAAKQAHFAAHAEARAANAVPQAAPAYAPQAYVQQPAAPAYAPVAASLEDGETYPAAELYYHEEIPAEPYIHQDPGYQHVAIPAEPYVEGAAPAAPVQQTAYAAGPVYANQPAQATAYSGCFNWKGEAVECRY